MKYPDEIDFPEDYTRESIVRKVERRDREKSKLRNGGSGSGSGRGGKQSSSEQVRDVEKARYQRRFTGTPRRRRTGTPLLVLALG